MYTTRELTTLDPPLKLRSNNIELVLGPFNMYVPFRVPITMTFRNLSSVHQTSSEYGCLLKSALMTKRLQ